MTFFKERELKEREVKSGIMLKSVYGEKTMLTIFNIDPDSPIPNHRHENEQITYIIEGELEFNLNGEIKILGPGDGVVVASNTEHSARTLGKAAKAIDAWFPIREDYKM